MKKTLRIFSAIVLAAVIGSAAIAETDSEKIKGWHRSAEQGDAETQNLLGLAYFYGDGVDKDQREGMRWFHKAAKQEYAEAQFNLGVAHWTGSEVYKDHRKALRWMRKAAKQGFMLPGRSAQSWLDGFVRTKANELETEIEKEARIRQILSARTDNADITKTESEKFEGLRKAAEQGDAEAQYLLGLAYWSGDGVDKDEREGVRWFHKAADQGYVRAQFKLGATYWAGDGVDKDERAAVRWWRKAAEQGSQDAQKMLRMLGE